MEESTKNCYNCGNIDVCKYVDLLAELAYLLTSPRKIAEEMAGNCKKFTVVK